MNFTWKFHYNWGKKVIQVHNLDGNKVAEWREELTLAPTIYSGIMCGGTALASTVGQENH